MYHLGTSKGPNLPERFSPGEIVRGDGDGFLVALTRDIAAVGTPTYMRGLLGEMNNCNNPYASHSCSGARRDADHSPTTFIKAWKRVYVIMHGGDVSAINEQLARVRLRPFQTNAQSLPLPQIAFVWAPMTGGAPNISALRPQVYWPGGAGSTGSARASTARFRSFTGLDRFYKDFALGKRKPFAIAESGDLGLRRARLRRPPVRLDRQPQEGPDGPVQPGRAGGGIFRRSRYPASSRVVRDRLAHPRHLGYAPELR